MQINTKKNMLFTIHLYTKTIILLELFAIIFEKCGFVKIETIYI